MFTRWAARPKCRSSATARKHRNWLNSNIDAVSVLVDADSRLDLQ